MIIWVIFWQARTMYKIMHQYTTSYITSIKNKGLRLWPYNTGRKRNFSFQSFKKQKSNPFHMQYQITNTFTVMHALAFLETNFGPVRIEWINTESFCQIQYFLKWSLIQWNLCSTCHFNNLRQYTGKSINF